MKLRTWSYLGVATLTAVLGSLAGARWSAQPPAPPAAQRAVNAPAHSSARTVGARDALTFAARRTWEAESPGADTPNPGATEPARQRDLPDPAPNRPGSVVPHPFDAARLRLDAQRAAFTRIDHAVVHGDHQQARALLQEHDRTFGLDEAWHDLREGYQLLLDCIEYPSDETRARGRRFVDEQRGSTLRRRVRRSCAEARSSSAASSSHPLPSPDRVSARPPRSPGSPE